MTAYRPARVAVDGDGSGEFRGTVRRPTFRVASRICWKRADGRGSSALVG